MLTPQEMQTLHAAMSFERLGPLKRALKKLLLHPFGNYMPRGMLRGLLRFGQSELATANWSDPGGWRSMVISYDGSPRQIADKVLVGGGTISMALRNRKGLASRLLAGMIDACPRQPAHVLCLGAGPGQIIMEAMRTAQRPARATLVDLSSDAFDFGLQLAAKSGFADRVRYVQGDVREVGLFLDTPPDIVKMLGICEYLPDETIVQIVSAVAEVMPAGGMIVSNSLSRAHGTDRFCRRVLGLNMIYRTPEQLTRLLRQAGFGQFVSLSEPLNVYHVLAGVRQASKGSAQDG